MLAILQDLITPTWTSGQKSPKYRTTHVKPTIFDMVKSAQEFLEESLSWYAEWLPFVGHVCTPLTACSAGPMLHPDGETDKIEVPVPATPDHSGFSNGGLRVCPGHFFAEGLLEIVSCHLLSDFEWKLLARSEKQDAGNGHGFDVGLNLSRACLQVRR